MKSLALLFFSLLFIFSLSSQELPNPQSLLESWDSALVWEEGMYEISILGEPASTKEILGSMYINSLQDRSFRLQTPDGNPLQKFLYIESLRSSHLSHPNQSLILKLSEEESMKKEIQSTSFSFYDISGFFLEKNYLIERMEPYKTSDKKYWKLIVVPISKNYYQKLYVYVEQESKLPYRIDYFNPQGLLLKILRVRRGKVPVQSKDKKEFKEMFSEFEMTRMSDSKKSYFRILTQRTHPPLDAGLFSLRSLRF